MLLFYYFKNITKNMEASMDLTTINKINNVKYLYPTLYDYSIVTILNIYQYLKLYFIVIKNVIRQQNTVKLQYLVCLLENTQKNCCTKIAIDTQCLHKKIEDSLKKSQKKKIEDVQISLDISIVPEVTELHNRIIDVYDKKRNEINMLALKLFIEIIKKYIYYIEKDQMHIHIFIEAIQQLIFQEGITNDLYKCCNTLFKRFVSEGSLLKVKILYTFDNIYYLQSFWNDQIPQILQHNIFKFTEYEVKQYIREKRIELLQGEKVFGLFIMHKNDFNKLSNNIEIANDISKHEVNKIKGYEITPHLSLPIPKQMVSKFSYEVIDDLKKTIRQCIRSNCLNNDINDYVIVMNREFFWNSELYTYGNKVRLNFPGGKKKYYLVEDELKEESDIETLIREISEEWLIDMSYLKNYVDNFDVVNVKSMNSKIYTGYIPLLI